MKPTDFSIYLTTFLTEYLPMQRNMSKNTITSYCDAFSLFLQFCRDERNIPIERLALKSVDRDSVNAFLLWLESERGNSTATINQRLGAIHSFFRYVQAECPQYLHICQTILSIKMRKKARPLVNYLSIDEVKLILEQPDTSTARGRRDLAMLSLMYDSGARVQEIADLKVRDLRLQSPASVRLFGKGRKAREIPVMKDTADLCRCYLDEYRLTTPDKLERPLFFNARQLPFTRAGITYILNKHVEAARRANSHLPNPISPHVMRHTKAMHLLQAGVNLVYIRDILGHIDIGTTEVYARADTEMKRVALEKAGSAPIPASVPAWAKDDDLMQWLRAYGKSCT